LSMSCEPGPRSLPLTTCRPPTRSLPPFRPGARLSISPKAEYFTRPGLRGQFVSRLFREFGHVPVDRADTHAAAATIQTGVDLLADGKALGIYPEGTRSPDGRLHKFHTGVARHALRSGAPVIPVGLIGTDRVLIASDRRWHRSRRVPACPRRRRAERSRHDCPLAGTSRVGCFRSRCGTTSHRRAPDRSSNPVSRRSPPPRSRGRMRSSSASRGPSTQVPRSRRPNRSPAATQARSAVTYPGSVRTASTRARWSLFHDN
jgi:hypothetical protein